MRLPVSTYRVQLNSEFKFEDLREQVEYLQQLGISTIYASPIFQARKGSMHGYDVVDPYTINHEIGNLQEFRVLVQELHQLGMNWLQDIVPNHMAYDAANPWVKDIFELGPRSRYYRYFDIDWEESGQVMAPFLGVDLGEILEKLELQLKLQGHGFSWTYYKQEFPASHKSYAYLLEVAGEAKWTRKFENFSGNDNQWEDLKIGFLREVQEDDNLKNSVETALENLNSSSERLKQVLELQFFRPAYWRRTEKEINYRRFFTINELICLRAEDQDVLETYHYYLKELIEQNLISGLRIDHIDGLYNPKDYLKNLYHFIAAKPYLVVEKILESEEELPEDWSAQGTTGYDFLAYVNQLFAQPKNEVAFTDFYKEIAPHMADYRKLRFQKKHFILTEEMGGELDNLTHDLKEKGLISKDQPLDEANFKEALAIFLSSFPVYRIYPDKFPLTASEKAYVEAAYMEAEKYSDGKEKELEFLKFIFLGEGLGDPEDMLSFLKRSQQFTGPVMAKGIEDTMFYCYNRLLSRNEVGDSPEIFGRSIASFHQKMKDKLDNFPNSLNATATHDTKRGEDARMRLNVLSELPEDWFEKVREWKQMNKSLRKEPEVPDSNEEYFIYQSLIGAFPFEEEDLEGFLKRMKDYLKKALREAKVHSSWSEPDEVYEAAVQEFLHAILKNAEFLQTFQDFHKRIAYFGTLKSLGQTLLKITAPGIPDVYQGTELWDFSLVDPDNRRSVGYQRRKKYSVDIKGIKKGDLNDRLTLMKTHFSDGKIKMYLLSKALKFRNDHRELFEKGTYLPIDVSGNFTENIMVFVRQYKDNWALIVVPVHVTEIFGLKGMQPEADFLSPTKLHLPEEAPKEWKNCLTETFIDPEVAIDIQALLKEFPVGLLTNIK